MDQPPNGPGNVWSPSDWRRRCTDPTLQIFLLLLVAVGFLTAAATRTDSWVATLSLGMGWVGLQFVTPLGQPMGSFLEAVGPVSAAALTIFTALLYVIADGPVRARWIRRR